MRVFRHVREPAGYLSIHLEGDPGTALPDLDEWFGDRNRCWLGRFPA